MVQASSRIEGTRTVIIDDLYNRFNIGRGINMGIIVLRLFVSINVLTKMTHLSLGWRCDGVFAEFKIPRVKALIFVYRKLCIRELSLGSHSR